MHITRRTGGPAGLLRGKPGSDHGQAIMELALVLPFVMLVALALIEFGMVMHSYILVAQAAREAARAATFGDDDAAVAAVVAQTATSLDTDQLQVTVTPPPPRARGSQVTVDVVYTYDTMTPGFRQIVPEIPVRGRVSMRVE